MSTCHQGGGGNCSALRFTASWFHRGLFLVLGRPGRPKGKPIGATIEGSPTSRMEQHEEKGSEVAMLVHTIDWASFEHNADALDRSKS